MKTKKYIATKLANARVIFHVANAARRQQRIESYFNTDGERIYTIVVNK